VRGGLDFGLATLDGAAAAAEQVEVVGDRAADGEEVDRSARC